MRLMVTAAVLMLLTACSERPPPGPAQAGATAPEGPALLSVPALMESPGRWTGRRLTLIATLPDPESRVLSPGLAATGENAMPIDDPRRSLWLAEPLPVTTTAQLTDGAKYLKLRGSLSPPGAYGTDTRYLYQFSADTVSVLQPERTTLANVAANPRALDGALLELDGVLLVSAGEALIAETATDGGVPAPDARQIKLRDLIEEQIPGGLRRSGAVRYGPVTVVGWWQDGVLTPFLIRER